MRGETGKLYAVLYYRLAKKEEGDIQQEFGQQYVTYKQRTGMFLPRLTLGRQARQAGSVS
jgi:protein-S-isoprenylcysteine O-methyltransferase Ste14